MSQNQHTDHYAKCLVDLGRNYWGLKHEFFPYLNLKPSKMVPYNGEPFFIVRCTNCNLIAVSHILKDSVLEEIRNSTCQHRELTLYWRKTYMGNEWSGGGHSWAEEFPENGSDRCRIQCRECNIVFY